MPNLIGPRAAASRFSIESWPLARPMTAPANHYCAAFGHFSTIRASEPFHVPSRSPKGGLLAADKPMTLPAHEYRDWFSGARRRAPAFSAGGPVVVRGADAGCIGGLRRRALAQYSGFVFSVLDGLCAGGHRVGTCSPRNIQGFGAARGTTRPVRRHAGDCLCRHLRDVADMAVLNKDYE